MNKSLISFGTLVWLRRLFIWSQLAQENPTLNVNGSHTCILPAESLSSHLFSPKVFNKISIFDKVCASLIAFGTKKASLLMEYSLLAIWGIFSSHKNPLMIMNPLQFVIVLFWKKLKLGQVGAKVQGPYPGSWQQLVSCYAAAQFSGGTSSEMFGIKEDTLLKTAT